MITNIQKEKTALENALKASFDFTQEYSVVANIRWANWRTPMDKYPQNIIELVDNATGKSIVINGVTPNPHAHGGYKRYPNTAQLYLIHRVRDKDNINRVRKVNLDETVEKLQTGEMSLRVNGNEVPKGNNPGEKLVRSLKINFALNEMLLKTSEKDNRPLYEILRQERLISWTDGITEMSVAICTNKAEFNMRFPDAVIADNYHRDDFHSGIFVKSPFNNGDVKDFIKEIEDMPLDAIISSCILLRTHIKEEQEKSHLYIDNDDDIYDDDDDIYDDDDDDIYDDDEGWNEDEYIPENRPKMIDRNEPDGDLYKEEEKKKESKESKESKHSLPTSKIFRR